MKVHIIILFIFCTEIVFSKKETWSEVGKTEEELIKAYYCVHYDLWNKRTETYPYQRNVLKHALKGMKSPHLTIPTFHITGTNGKGSVTHKMASALNYAGYTTGEYLSPKIFTYRENIQVNGTKINQLDYVKHHQICARAVRNLSVTYKDVPNIGTMGLEFCIAFSYFLASKVDVAIVEVNIGGLNDHTNVLKPEGVVIVNVAVQSHGRVLPPTIEGILRHKAAIINPGKPVVVGNNMPLDLLHKIARKKNSTVYVVYPRNHTNFTYDEYNGMIVEKMLKVVEDKFPKLTDEAISKGLKTKLPLRSEHVPKPILDKLKIKWNLKKVPYKVIIEMKSDVFSIRTIFGQLRRNYEGKRIRVIVVFLRNWNMEERMKALFTHADEIHVIRTSSKTLKYSVPVEKYNFKKMIKNTAFEKYNFDFSKEEEKNDVENAVKRAFIASSEAKQEEILLFMNMATLTYDLLGMELETDQMPAISPTIKECRKIFHMIITRDT